MKVLIVVVLLLTSLSKIQPSTADKPKQSNFEVGMEISLCTLREALSKPIENLTYDQIFEYVYKCFDMIFKPFGQQKNEIAEKSSYKF